jgi:hypothetical protein
MEQNTVRLGRLSLLVPQARPSPYGAAAPSFPARRCFSQDGSHPHRAIGSQGNPFVVNIVQIRGSHHLTNTCHIQSILHIVYVEGLSLTRGFVCFLHGSRSTGVGNTAASSASRRPGAHYTRCHSLQLRSVDRTESGRSGLTAGTGPHTPHRTLLRLGIKVSTGWIPVLRWYSHEWLGSAVTGRSSDEGWPMRHSRRYGHRPDQQPVVAVSITV